MARKPAALARELLRNFPKGRRGKNRRRRKATGPSEAGNTREAAGTEVVETPDDAQELDTVRAEDDGAIVNQPDDDDLDDAQDDADADADADADVDEDADAPAHANGKVDELRRSAKTSRSDDAEEAA